MSGAFEGWAIVEIMGHRQRPGYVQEVEIAGGKMLRIDIPAPDGDATEFYGVASIYAIRPVSEQMARDQASGAQSRPVRPLRYAELPAPAAGAAQNDPDGLNDDIDDEPF